MQSCDGNHPAADMQAEFEKHCAEMFEKLFRTVYEAQQANAGSQRCATNVNNVHCAIYAAVCALQAEMSMFMDLGVAIAPDLKEAIEGPGTRIYPNLRPRFEAIVQRIVAPDLRLS